MKPRMRIGVTMGDPAGIGPEILVRAFDRLAHDEEPRRFDLVAIGNRDTLEAAARALGLSLRFDDLGAPTPGGIPLSHVEGEHGLVRPGEVSRAAGHLAHAAIVRSVELATAGTIGAVVTGPVSKEAINLAGIPFTGHTELYAELTGSTGTVMMLAHGKLCVTHVSTHAPLHKVPQLLTPRRLRRVIDLTIEALRGVGIARPRVAVAGLNPHAGENGLFGTEDATVIAPVVAEYAAGAAEVSGPHPGDTVFVKAAAGQFDAVVAMYHDQGHIPVKLLGFRIDRESGQMAGLSGVNVTLGLPIVRTSVDHGTAFDIAGKGIANAQNLVEAIRHACLIAEGRGGTSGQPPPTERS